MCISILAQTSNLSRSLNLLQYSNHLLLLLRTQPNAGNPPTREHSPSKGSNKNESRLASPRTGIGYPPTLDPSASSASSYVAFLGHLDGIHQRAQPTRNDNAVPARDPAAEDFAALKVTMKGLDIELPDHIIAGLAKRYDGMTPMERFLSEEGYWVPGGSVQGSHYGGSTQGAPHRRE